MYDESYRRLLGYGADQENSASREMYPDKDIIIIALSANAFAEDRQKSIDAGMNDHVAKPIRMSELMQVLNRHI